MAEPEETTEITQAQWDEFREAAANLGEAVKTFATSFAEAIRSIDWEGIREKLEQARLDIEAEREGETRA